MNDELPEGWAEVTVGAVADDIGYGFTAKSSDVADGPKYLRITDIQNGVVNWSSVPFCAVPRKKQATYALQRGDVVFARTGATTGKSYLITSCPDAVFASYLIRVRPSAAVLPEFIQFFFQSHAYWQQISENISGSAQPNFNASKLATLTMGLPPMSEQRRIVAKIETLLAKARSSQERLDKIPVILKRFRQAILAAACSGKLTADWRQEHPDAPAVCLDSCERLRKAKVNNANARAGRSRFRYAPAALIDIGDRTKGIDELFELPETWAWASLGQITWAVADGPHFSPKYVGPERGVPFISGRNISYNGIDFSNAKYVSPEDHAEFTKRTHPEVGDVLLTKGGTTGVATVVTTHREFSVWVHVAVLKVVDGLVNPSYLRDALSAPFAYVQSQAQTHGVGNQDLGLTRMVHIALPLPPLAEQAETVKRVQRAFLVADRLGTRYEKAKTHVDRVTQSVLAKAFRGELVTTEAELARREGWEYETAEELLQRIKGSSGRDTTARSRRRTRAGSGG